MKILIALLVACLVATALAQTQTATNTAASQATAAQLALAQAAAAAGGAAGAAQASSGRQSLFGGSPLMNMAAMSGQLGDTFQSASLCGMMNIPPFLCLSMGLGM